MPIFRTSVEDTDILSLGRWNMMLAYMGEKEIFLGAVGAGLMN